MTMMIHTLVALGDAPSDWKRWQLDYADHVTVLGEISGGRDDSYYHPSAALTADPRTTVVDVDSGFFVAEMDHATLMRFWGPMARITASPGSDGPGVKAGRRIWHLSRRKRYAVVWLEVW